MRVISSWWGARRPGVASLVVTSFFAAACGSEIDTHYGPPSGLSKQTTPTASGDGGAGGSTAGADAGGTGTTSALCGGQGAIDGGACGTASWTKIYGQMKSPWKCADAGCHGLDKASGGVAPFIDPASAHNAYMNLVGYTNIKATSYVNPCSLDPSQSMIVCNTASSGTCGAAQMPISGGGTPLTAQDTTDLTAWVTCGSPEN